MEKKSKIKDIFDTSVTIVLILAVVFFILFAAYYLNMFGINDFLKGVFGGDDQPEQPIRENYALISQALNDFESKKENYDRYVVTLEGAKKTLSEIIVPYSFYWNVKTTVTVSGEELVTEYDIYKKGTAYRINISGPHKKTITHNGESTYIRDDLTMDGRIIKKDWDFSYLDQVNIINLDTLLENDDNAILDFYILQTNGMDGMYVEAVNEKLEKHDIYFVSLEFGFITEAVSKLGDETVYKLETISLVRSPEIRDSYFAVPEN